MRFAHYRRCADAVARPVTLAGDLPQSIGQVDLCEVVVGGGGVELLTCGFRGASVADVTHSVAPEGTRSDAGAPSVEVLG